MSINRFRFSEISLGRLFGAVARRITDVPQMLAWSRSSGLAAHNRARLVRFRDRHDGERCFIMANGPSLARIDHSKLKHEWTFGLNRIYLMADELGYLPSYYVCVNELVLDQFHHEIARFTMPKFVNWNRREYFHEASQEPYFLRLKLNLSDTFSTTITAPISSGGTVTYVALQLAYYMGFQEVIIVGLDHDYSSRGIPNRAVVRQEDRDLDHFHPDYFPKGSLWQPPDLLRSELAYERAREAYRLAGRQIIDATLGGKCQVFEKSDLGVVFGGVKEGAP